MPTKTALPPEISSQLQKHIRGQVLTDTPSRGRYATDASIYQQLAMQSRQRLQLLSI
jgi:hypothetical protein